MKTLIRTTKHSIKFSNREKVNSYRSFLIDCRKVLSQYVDFLWYNKWTFKNKILDIQNEQYDIPSFISNVELESCMPDFNSYDLSARTRKCILTQAIGIIKASIEKQRKRKFVIDSKVSVSSKLLENYKQNFNKKPKLDNVNIELNSICCKFLECSSGHFNGFIQLSSLGKKYNKIFIPIKLHKHSRKFTQDGFVCMTSFLLSKEFIDFRWKKEITEKSSGKIVGIDQGFLDIASLSDGQVTEKIDSHGHSLESIILKLSRKQKGSNAFKRAQEHRRNFINWSLNRLNLKDIKQINLENVKNLRFKSRCNRVMSHWTYTIISEKIQSLAEISGVHVQLNSSSYRSQRCSSCGMVKKSHRKGKTYTCSSCGLVIDSDYNASLNHEVELPEIDFSFHNSKLNIKGFFWKPDGLFTLDGEAITVPLAENKQIFVNKN